MSEQHTPTPWSYQASIPEDGFECFFINGERKRISYFDGPQDDEQFSNVRRIVACVNACAGIKTEELERVSGYTTPVFDLLVKTTEQRDQLLAALEESRRIVADALAEYGDCDHSVGICNCDLKRSIEASDAAIASVKANT